MKNRIIGNIILDYEFYDPKCLYSDGTVEETILEAAKNGEEELLLRNSSDYAVLYHLSDIRENLLEWYPFRKDASLLEVGSGCGALTGLFAEKLKKVTCIEMSERRSEINAFRHKDKDNIKIFVGPLDKMVIREKFDYISLIGVWEYAGLYVSGTDPFLNMIEMLKHHLKDEGKMLIAIENKMGLKYWNGALEDHTSKRYEGLNDYPGYTGVRTFSKMEIENILRKLDFSFIKFYYPNPDYKLPDSIYTDQRLPRPGEIRNYKKDFNEKRLYNFSDSAVADQICADGVFGYFSNSFLVECGNTINSDVVYAKYSRNRKDEYKIATIIFGEKDRRVIKKHLDKKSKIYLERLKDKMAVDCKDDIELDYVEGSMLLEMMYNHRNNAGDFVSKSSDYLEKYIESEKYEVVKFYPTGTYVDMFGENYVENADCFRKSNVDIIFSNLILRKDNKIVNIDREWILDCPVPIEYSKWRAFDQLYSSYMYYLKGSLTREKYLEQVGINLDNIRIYRKMEKNFRKKIMDEYTLNYIKPSITAELVIK